MHLAVAVGTPTISMHGPSRAEWCGAYGAGNVRLQNQYDSRPARKQPGADDSAMRSITVDQVREACESMLDQHVQLGRKCG